MKKQNKTYLAIGIIAVILIAAIVMFSNQGKEEEPIRVGVILPLTGVASYIGEQELNGISLALEEIKNEKVNGRSVEFIIEDGKSTPEGSISAANKLINIDGVKILLSALTGPSSAVAPLTEKNKIILLYESTTDSIAIDKKYVFSTFPSARSFCKEATTNAISKGKMKLAYLTDILSGGLECEEGIKEALKENPKAELVITEKFDLKDPDFRTSITKIKEKNPDGLIIYTYGTQFPMIFKNIVELNFKTTLVCPFITSTCEGNRDAVKIAESANLFNGAEGSDFYFDPKSEDLEIQNFVAKYESKFGKTPNGFSAHPYEDVKIVLETLRECGGNENVECLREKLLGSKHEGITGTASFQKEGILYVPVKSKEYIDGTWVER